MRDSSSDACEQTPGVVGRCRAAFRRWTYDPQTGECKSFTYGGCGGNENNFETQGECEEACEVALGPEGNVCELDIVPGPCEALFPSWGFDGESCVRFNYGGCGGNGNRFETESECQAACGMMPAEAPGPGIDTCGLEIVPGPCRAFFPSWGFDGEECVEFVYGGCGGNGNRFETEAECAAACGMMPAEAPGPGSDTCDLAIVPGPCRAFFPSWGFDGEECVEFVYGGCGGNSNRFETEAECEAACEGVGDICTLPIFPPEQEIFCTAAFLRWTYDAKEGCVEFIYGGCGGTANIFESKKECLAACGP